MWDENFYLNMLKAIHFQVKMWLFAENNLFPRRYECFKSEDKKDC